MKLGAAYNVFDGEELLENSIVSIRPEVDYVVVVYQTCTFVDSVNELGLCGAAARRVRGSGFNRAGIGARFCVCETLLDKGDVVVHTGHYMASTF